MNESYEVILNSNNDTNATNWSVPYSENDYYVEEDYNVEEDLLEKMPLSVSILFIIVGTIGNCLVCLAILLNRKLQNLTNYFLLSLAVTDLAVSLLVLPGRLLILKYKLYPPIFPLCYLYLVGDDFVVAASFIHIAFMSFDRYFAIKNPFDRRNLTKNRVAIKIGLVWAIAFLTIIPYMTFAIISKHLTEPTYCEILLAEFTNFEEILLIEALIILVMILVVVVSFILTTSLLYELAKKQEKKIEQGDFGLVRTVGGQTTDHKSNNKKALQVPQTEKKALRVVWLISFAFIICMAPTVGTSFFYLAFPDILIPSVVLELSSYSIYLNSVINPIIYTLFNKNFRYALKDLILFKCKKV